ncbi:alpha/beta hydrolase [Halioxenophilus aromaticivorans]|uniref:Alpha/beta hydrolase n=1 Tax=Halioxenophilus aromaticivorans TaxID=1306992 RepID=A0AAV3U7Q0_9ALTE
MLPFVSAVALGSPLVAPEKPQVYIVPGYMATPEDHWFRWLQSELESKAEVTVVTLPNPQAPSAQAWQQQLQHSIGEVNSHTVIVAHSLGSIATLRFLQSLPDDWALAGLVLVAGFDQPLAKLPQLDAFTAPPIDTAGLARRIAHRSVYASPADTIVPFAHSQRLAIGLNAELVEVPKAGHFLAEDGFRTFPQLYREVTGLLLEIEKRESEMR